MRAMSHALASPLPARCAGGCTPSARTPAPSFSRVRPGCSGTNTVIRRRRSIQPTPARRRVLVRADSGYERPSGAARVVPGGPGPVQQMHGPVAEPWWKRFLLPFAWISALLSRLPQWAARKKLANLKEAAESAPEDAAAQLAYLQELNRRSPEQVIEHMREGKNATSEPIVVEYIKALVTSGQLSEYAAEKSTADAAKADHRSLPTLLEQLKASASGDNSEFAPGDSSRRPLHVVVDGATAPIGERGAAGFLKRLFSSILTIVILAFVWLVGVGAARKYVGNSQGSALGTGPGMGTSNSSHAPKEYNKDTMPEKSVKTFNDVKGCDEAKAELEEIVEYLKTPEKFTRLGGKLPKGVLLTGDPGTGKTLLARAVAGEAGVPFFYRAGSEFEEMFVGVGSRRVRSLFAAAKKKAPCIVFVDEIDAVGGNRKQWESHSRKTLNQMLVEMDGFEANEGVIVMAATNLPETLDPALTRPGRFDRHVAVPLPDVSGRLDILLHYMKDKPMSDEVNTKLIARNTPGFSGAQLANLVNEAALIAAKTNQDSITPKMLDEARDKILMGVERKSLTQSEEARKLTAYHEGGHALVAMLTQGANPIHKATIVPRGHALGMVTQLPDNDEFSITKEQMIARIDVCMGGKVAEELIFGANKVTSGATNDLKQATRMAQHMVADCGMSDDIGPMHVDTMMQHNHGAGGALRQKVDAEVSRLLREAHKRVTDLLSTNEHKLHSLASALLEHETLTQQQIRNVLDGSFQAKTPGGPDPPAENKDAELEDEAQAEERVPVAAARAADAATAAAAAATATPAIGNT